MATLPLTLVLACGSAVPGPGPGALDHLVSHPLAAHRRLEALSAAGTAELLRRRLQRNVRESLGRVAHAVTAGNPLLVEQLAAALLESGLEHFEESPDAVATLAPPATAESLLQRTAVLGSDTAALLQSIAVLGQGAQLHHAAELAAVGRARAAELRDVLCAAGILVQAEKLGFTQPIVGAALEDGLPLGRRAELHLQAAGLLEEDEAPPDVVAARDGGQQIRQRMGDRRPRRGRGWRARAR